jgi:RNA polymerase sigma-70 factor (ECF subfamily)
MTETDELLAPWSLLSRLKIGMIGKAGRNSSTLLEADLQRAVKAGLNDAEAQDVVQETVITAAKNLERFKTDPTHGSFKGWLLHTTRWRIADQFRKRTPAGSQLLAEDGRARHGRARARPAA